MSQWADGVNAELWRRESRIAELESALETAAQRFALLAAADDTMRNGVRPSVGAAEARAALQKKAPSE